MNRKSQKIARLIDSPPGARFDPHYLGYFKCFNQQLFFEAHEVLEALWLPQRGQAKDLFYKGLIQLAGAFVHVQKKRPQPAVALLRLAAAHLSRYPDPYEGLDLDAVQGLISIWMKALDGQLELEEALRRQPWPKLSLHGGL